MVKSRLVISVVVVLSVLLMGCGGGDGSSSAGEQASTASTAGADVTAAAVVSSVRSTVDRREGEPAHVRYEAYIEAFYTALDAPFADPESEDLLALIGSERARKVDKEFIQSYRDAGEILRFPRNKVLEHTFVAISEGAPLPDAEKAYFYDCQLANTYVAPEEETERKLNYEPDIAVYFVVMARESSDSDWFVDGTALEKVYESKEKAEVCTEEFLWEEKRNRWQ